MSYLAARSLVGYAMNPLQKVLQDKKKSLTAVTGLPVGVVPLTEIARRASVRIFWCNLVPAVNDGEAP
jgi:hypothetical protein